MGVSAISGIGACYAQNDRDVAPYGERVERRGIATMRGYRLSDDDLLRRTVISRILSPRRLHTSEIEREFGIPFSTTDSLRKSRGSPRLFPTASSISMVRAQHVPAGANLHPATSPCSSIPILKNKQLESRPRFQRRSEKTDRGSCPFRR